MKSLTLLILEFLWHAVCICAAVFVIVLIVLMFIAMMDDMAADRAHKANGDTYVPGHWELKK